MADGDVPAGAPVSEMASFYTTVLHGLTVRAREGASRQALMAAADAAMAAWDPPLFATSCSNTVQRADPWIQLLVGVDTATMHPA